MNWKVIFRSDEFGSKVHVESWSLDLQNQMEPRMLYLCVVMTMTIPKASWDVSVRHSTL